MGTFQIRPLNHKTDTWISEFLTTHWGSTQLVTRGVIHNASCLPGFVAVDQGEHIGLITYNTKYDECEIISLDSMLESMGVGSALIEAVKQKAITTGCRRLWLITTNDNLKALHYYQQRDFRLVVVHRNAIEQSRKLKPQIPQTGLSGIPILDEIELEMMLS